MVKNPELDAIVVVSPSMFHAEHIKLTGCRQALLLRQAARHDG